MPTVQLPDRSVILVDGSEAEGFLQNIITTDLDKLAPGEVKPGALLTPQGKILFDFLVSRAPDTGIRLDCRAEIADDFVRRLTLYRMRAKIGIAKQEQGLVLARWRDESATSSTESTGSEIDSSWLRDDRFPASAKVERGYAASSDAPIDIREWTRLRIAHGIAESGDDYALADAFPHDVLLDETGGVGLRKGCYVGQEVVSRMHHRGTARRRVMLVEGSADLPSPGADIRANDRSIGTLGSAHGGRGLAIVRIDRVKDALDAGHAITTEGLRIELSIPGWAKYTLPQAAAGAAEG